MTEMMWKQTQKK